VFKHLTTQESEHYNTKKERTELTQLNKK